MKKQLLTSAYGGTETNERTRDGQKKQAAQHPTKQVDHWSNSQSVSQQNGRIAIAHMSVWAVAGLEKILPVRGALSITTRSSAMTLGRFGPIIRIFWTGACGF